MQKEGDALTLLVLIFGVCTPFFAKLCAFLHKFVIFLQVFAHFCICLQVFAHFFFARILAQFFQTQRFVSAIFQPFFATLTLPISEWY